MWMPSAAAFAASFCLRGEDGSMWPAAVLHAAHNNLNQAIFGPLTAADDKMFFVSETGVYTILCAWLLAAALYVGETTLAASAAIRNKPFRSSGRACLLSGSFLSCS